LAIDQHCRSAKNANKNVQSGKNPHGFGSLPRRSFQLHIPSKVARSSRTLHQSTYQLDPPAASGAYLSRNPSFLVPPASTSAEISHRPSFVPAARHTGADYSASAPGHLAKDQSTSRSIVREVVRLLCVFEQRPLYHCGYNPLRVQTSARKTVFGVERRRKGESK
jgi:hypothetical protein